MLHPQLIGLVAATLTTLSFVPQVLRIWRTRHARDISLPAFGVFAIGVFLWLVYGILERNLPLILSNSFTLVLAAGVLALTFRFRGNADTDGTPPSNSLQAGGREEAGLSAHAREVFRKLRRP